MKNVNKKLIFLQKEGHTRVNWLRDVILGGQDGLVNVLGVVLGVSAASQDKNILIAASMAAAFAEAVSMGAVAYTSSLAEKDHYQKELERETKEVEEMPEREKEEVKQIYQNKGFEGELLEKIVGKIVSNKKVWIHTMMDEELGLNEVKTTSILKTALVVGFAALFASFIPIAPFVFFAKNSATVISIIISALTLFIMGVYEAKTYVGSWQKNGMQMVVIGIGAALIGFLVGKIFRVN